MLPSVRTCIDIHACRAPKTHTKLGLRTFEPMDTIVSDTHALRPTPCRHLLCSSVFLLSMYFSLSRLMCISLHLLDMSMRLNKSWIGFYSFELLLLNHGGDLPPPFFMLALGMKLPFFASSSSVISSASRNLEPLDLMRPPFLREEG